MEGGRSFEAAMAALGTRISPSGRRALAKQAERWSSAALSKRLAAAAALAARARRDPRLAEISRPRYGRWRRERGRGGEAERFLDAGRGARTTKRSGAEAVDEGGGAAIAPGRHRRREKSSSWSKPWKAMRSSPAVAGMADRHLVAQRETELFFERARVGVDGFGDFGGAALRLPGALAQALDVAHRQAFGDDAVGDRVRVGDGEQRARVAGGNRPGRKKRATVFGQIGQAHRIGDMAAAFADDAGDVGVGVAVIGGELLVAVAPLRGR